MATVNALSVALFNAAAGGYAAEMTANPAGFANAVGPILQKDVSTDALFVEHLLANFGVASTNTVYAQAKTALTALVTTKGRAGAAADAVDFLKAQEGSTSAYATIAADFAAKVNKAAAFSAAHATERDITVLVSGVTGVDTDAAAIASAVAAAEAAAAAAAAAAATKAAADLAAANAAAEAAATKAAADLAAVKAELEALKNPVGTAKTLTTSTDAFVGTAGNDTITAASSTYGSSDVIVDSSTADKDVLNIAATSDISATPTVNGIETINLTLTGFTAGGDTTFAVAGDNIGTTTLNAEVVGSTAVTTLNATALATGTTVNATSTFTTVTVTADDNAVLTINGIAKSATSTVNVDANATAGALTDVAVNVTVGSVDVDATDMDGTLTVVGAQDVNVDAAAATAAVITAGDDVTITDLTAATSVTITAGGYVSAAGNKLDGAETLTITAGDEVDVDFDAALTATISAKGTNLSTTGGADSTSTLTGEVVTTLNLSGNGGAVDFNITDMSDTVKTINVSGTQNVKIAGDISVMEALGSTGLKIANTNTGTTTLSLSGTIDNDVSLKNVATSVGITLTADVGTAASDVITLASGAAVTFAAAQGATQTAEFSGVSTTASTNTATFTVDKAGTSSSTVAIGSLTTTNIKTVTINLDKDAVDTTLGTVNVGTANNVVINTGANSVEVTDITASKATFTGSGDLDLGTLTIATLDATAVTGDVLYTIAANDVVQTGSGDDVISGLSDIDANVSTGSGSDTVELDADLSDNTVVVDMGDGDADEITLADATSTNGSTVTLLGVDRITFLGATAAMRDSQLSGTAIEIFGTAATTHTITIGLSQATNDFSGLDIDAVTFTSGDDSFVIDARTRTAAVNIIGTDADDAIYGTEGGSTGAYADTLSGGTGADTFYISQGGDVVSGGAGNDTINLTEIDDTYTDIEGGTSDAIGMIVNLGATSVSTATVASNSDLFISKSLTSIAATAFGYMFAADSTSNSAVVGTMSSIENVTGSSGKDYIVGSASANILDGGADNDYISGGAGNDTITGGTGVDKIIGGTGADAIVLGTDTEIDTLVYAAGDSTTTITVTSGTGRGSASAAYDTVSGFDLAGVDILDLAGTATVAADQLALVNGTDSTAVLTTGAPGTDVIKSHEIADGIITFDDQSAGAFSAVSLGDAGDVAAAIQYLSLNDLGDAGVTVAFVGNSNSYVYQQTATSAGATGGFTLIELTGVTALSLMTSGTTAGGVLIG